MGKNKKDKQQGAISQAVLEATLPAVSPCLKTQLEGSWNEEDDVPRCKYLDAPLGVYNWKGLTVKDRLALVMMIKNEEKRIEVTFDSVRSICNTFVILDTGSTDRTIEIVNKYCKKHSITLHLAQKPFVDFQVSRNDLLDFADEALKNHYFMLLLDCNDELRNHAELTDFIERYTAPSKATGFHLRQQWWTGISLDTYYNIRMVLSHFGWRYREVVHEFIARVPGKDSDEDIMKCPNIVLFQDRTMDDDKTQKRFKRDKQLLYSAHIKRPTAPRTLFYLAQTCNCLNQPQEAYEYNLLRTKYLGFHEEVFHAYLRLGGISERLGHPWEESLHWYMKAYSRAKRAEPLVAIADHYINVDAFGRKEPDWHLAYMFISQACKLNFPHSQILFVDKNVYIYKRWHLLGRVGYYVNRFSEGKEACLKALMAQESKLDMDNLMFYIEKEEDIQKKYMLQQAMNTADLKLDPYVTICLDNGEFHPESEKGLGFGNAFTREEVLNKAKKHYMQWKK